MDNSKHRKNWPWDTLNDLVLTKIKKPKIAILGLTYKENTQSIKNSPSIALLNKIQGHSIAAFDPVAEMDVVGKNITRTEIM